MLASEMRRALFVACNHEQASTFCQLLDKLNNSARRFLNRGDYGGKHIATLVLCNRYGLPIAARSLGEFQGASEAPVSFVILAEQVFLGNSPKEPRPGGLNLKMARRPRCVSVTGCASPARTKGHACFAAPCPPEDGFAGAKRRAILNSTIGKSYRLHNTHS